MMHSRVRRGTSRSWWLECGGWLGLGLVLLGALAGAAWAARDGVHPLFQGVETGLQVSHGGPPR
jgi:hypothetical protein